MTGAEGQPFPPFKDPALLPPPLEAILTPLPPVEELPCPEILTPIPPVISNPGLASDSLGVEEILISLEALKFPRGPRT